MKSTGYVGRCLAAVAGGFFGWLAGAHFSTRWSWVGMLVGAVLFAVLEDVPRTLRVAREVWKSVVSYKLDWSGLKGGAVLFSLLILSMTSWLIIPLSLGCDVGKFDPFLYFMGCGSGCLFAICFLGILENQRICEMSGIDVASFITGGLSAKEDHTGIEFVRLLFMLSNIFSAVLMGSVFLLIELVIFLYRLPSRVLRCIGFLLVKLPKWAVLTIVRLASQQKTATGMLGTAIGVAIGLWCGRTILCGGIGAVTSLTLVIFADALALFAKRFEKPAKVSVTFSS